MTKVTQLQIAKKTILFMVTNILLLTILYLLPINDNAIIPLCLFKAITGKECFNCGMTRAFLSMLHFDYINAIKFNKNVILVFPFAIILYLNFWIKYFKCKKEGEK